MPTPARKSSFLPAADYVRVEIRIGGGVTYTYELEPGPNLPIEVTASVDTAVREAQVGLARTFEPELQTAAIQVSGKLARADRKVTP